MSVLCLWVCLLAMGGAPTAHAGSILREVFLGIGGSAVADLTNNPAYPNKPSSTNYVSAFFEAPVDFAENYGQRMHGYVVPPVTGNYTFWVATDDGGELWLSTDENPANRKLIASVNAWTGSREWTKEPNQKSAAMRLEAGKAYYVMALQKEGGGGDNLAVRWLRPDGVDEGPIPGTYLQPYGISFTPPVILQQPTNTTAIEGQNAFFYVKLQNLDAVNFRWFRNGVPAGSTNSSYFSYGPVTLDDNGAIFSATLTNRLGATNTGTATLSVTPDVTRPELVSVINLGANTIRLGFSEALSETSATVAGNYSVSGGVTVSAAGFGPDFKTVVLTTSTLTFGSNYTISLANLADRARTPNFLAAETRTNLLALELVAQDFGGGGSILRAGTGAYDVTGGGADIGGTTDQFQFAWEQRTGNFDIQTRVEGVTVTDPFLKAGLMARSSFQADAPFAGIFAASLQAGCFFESRATTGASASVASINGGFPVNYPQTWLRLRRVGNVFTGFGSLDGQSWVQLGSATITLPSQVYLGLAASSGNPAERTTARFRDYGPTASSAVTTFTRDREPLGPSSRRTGLIFSEVMYHAKPRPDNTNRLEFIELYNAGSIFEDMGGYRLEGGVAFTFPAGFRLAAGDFVVVAADPAALQTAYGITKVLGPFTGALNNSGDTVRLVDHLGAIRLELAYSNKAPWPAAADGAGHSLSLTRPSYGEADARAWGASELTGGSPGGADPIVPNPRRAVVINEFLAHTDDPQTDFIELYNHSNSPVDLGGCILTDDAGTNKFRIPEGTSIPARGFLAFDQNQLGFRLSAEGETILFLDPGATRVIDAIRFGAQENGVASGRSPDGADTIRRLARPTPGAANAAWRSEEIVINELMFEPISGNDADEYVELYNRGSVPVNLGDWRFVDGVDLKFPPGTMLPAGSFLVVAKDAGRMRANYSHLTAANTLGNFDGSLRNSGERLALAKPDDIVSTNATGKVTTNKIFIVVSEVTYGAGGHWGRYAAGGGSSLELIDPAADALRPASWADSDETKKSQWQTVEATGKLDFGHASYQPVRLHVTMMGDGGEALVDDIEVFKPGGANLLLNGGFEDGSGLAATGWSFFGNHGSSSVDADGAFGGARCLHLRAQGDGDTAVNTLRTGLAGLVGGNTATIRAKARWLAGAPELLFRLRGNWLELAARLTVPKNLGTPGLPNSRLAANAGPAIYDVRHTPLLPRANEAVVVSCRVSDPDGIGAVSLRVRMDPSTSFTTVTMRDDGAGGDAVAGDGVYSGSITGRSAGAIAGFKILATDSALTPASSTFPQTNLLPVALPSAEAYIRWDDPVPAGTFAHYHLWNSQATDAQRTNPLINTYRDATLVYGNSRVIYNAGFRDKGSPYHGGGGSYAVINPPDEPLLGDSERVFRTTGNGGAEETGLRNQVCAWIGKEMGIPYLHSHYMQLYRNGQQHQNITQDEEIPTKSYAKSWYPGDEEGDLYKIAFWFEFQDNNTSFDSVGSSLESFKTDGGVFKLARYRWIWQSRGLGGTQNNYSNVFSLVTVANDTSTNYVSNLSNLADMDEWMRVFAFDRLIGNWDSWGYGGGQNMYGYKVTGGKWRIMPWDVDFVLGAGDSATTALWGGPDPVVNRMFDTPAFRRMLWRAYQDIINGPFLAEKSGPVLDAYRSALVKNNIGGLSPHEGVKTWMAQRRAYIQSQLQANDTAAFTITSNGGGNYTSTTATTRITGRAPFAVAAISVNGVPYPVTWTDPVTYALNVPLTARTTVLTLTGLDRTGAPVSGATRTVTVTYNGAVQQPEDYVVINEVQYQPVATGASFIELFNRSTTTPFDLSGFRLDGLAYNFPNGSIIQPNSYLVLAGNRAGFNLAYGPTAPVFAEYPGNLDNNGEKLELVKPNGGPGGTNDLVISDVRYNDKLPWPTNAAGAGPSLQLIDALQGSFRVGNWGSALPGAVNQATPGTANTAVRQAIDPFPPVWLNELLPGKVNGPRDNAGESDPFVELYNAGESAVDLSRYYLSDDYTNLTKWAFPAGSSIGPRQFLVVWLDGQPAQSIAGVPHTSFRIDAATGGLAFSRLQGTANAPAVMDFLDYKQLASGRGWGSYPDGDPRHRQFLFFATPGAINNPALPETRVVINEFMADNSSIIRNPVGGGFDDWFELHNPGVEAVNLSDYTLTDDLTKPDKFKIPAGRVIQAAGYLLVWADNNPAANTNGGLHVNFKLSKSGNQLGLFAPGLKPMDTLTFGVQTNDISQGRFPDGGGDLTNYFAAPTPGAPNVLAGGNHPPVLKVAGTQSVEELSRLSFVVTAADADAGQTLGFSLDPGVPAGAVLDSVTGAFEWTPTEAQGPGVYSIIVRVTDNGMPARSASQAVLVTVSERNQAPVLSPLTDVTVEEGGVVTFTASATDADLPPQNLTFSLLPGAPAGAAIDARTGVFTWSIPDDTVSATNVISVRVQDSGPGNLGDTKSFTVITKGRFRVVINEIMYQPALTNAAYVELLNTSGVVTQDLAGCRLAGANLSFVFPTGSLLAPGRFLVVAQNRAAFAAAYGTNLPVFGEWTGRLDRAETRLRLIDAAGDTLQQVDFGASLPWPAAAGAGSALQLVDARRDNSRPANWDAAPAQQWQHVVATGTASSSALYFYLETVGDAYLDDVRLVAGSDADTGANLLANGDFESVFPGPYAVGDNHRNSSVSTSVKHGGTSSLHLVTTAGGTTRASAITQDITPALAANETHTLSYWYLPNTNGGILTLRLSGNGIRSTVDLRTNSVTLPRFTPGATNSVAASLAEFPALWINEVQPGNTNEVAGFPGVRAPWLELVNAGKLPVSLEGWSLANNYTNLAQWPFPAGTVIAPGQFLVILADGRAEASTATELHTNFRLGQTNGSLALSRPQSAGLAVVDYLDYQVSGPDQSHGRDPGQFPFVSGALPQPTPGKANLPIAGAAPSLSARVGLSGELVLAWTAQAGVRYRVETRESLSLPWRILVELTAASTSASVTETTLNAPERYYRIVVAPPQ